MNFWFIVVGCLLTPALAFAANCDCTHFPIQPAACFRPCQAAILLKSDKGDLTQQFKLDEKTASLFVERRDSNPAIDLQTSVPRAALSTALKSATKLSAEQTSALGEKYNLNSVDVDKHRISSLALSMKF